MRVARVGGRAFVLGIRVGTVACFDTHEGWIKPGWDGLYTDIRKLKIAADFMVTHRV